MRDMKIKNLNLRYAGFWRRLLAYFVDGAVVSIISAPFTNRWQVQMEMFKQLSEAGSMDALQQLQQSQVAGNNLSLISALITMLYFAVLIVNFDGATIGMKLMALRLVPDPDQNKSSSQEISYLTAIVRHISAYLSGAVFGLGYLAMLGHPKKQTWHDRIAKTVVIKTERKPRRLIALILGGVFFLFTISMFVFGIVVALGIAQSDTGQIKQMVEVNQTYQQYKDQMSPEVAEKYEASKEYFAQLRANNTDPTKVSQLNNENIDNLLAALEIDPTNPLLWQDLSSAYTWANDRGTLEDGLEAAKKAVEFFPDNPTYIAELGAYYMRLEKYDQAVLELKKSLRLEPENGMAHLSIAKAYQQLGINETAADHFQQALDYFEKKNDESGQYDQYILAAQKGLSATQ